jgi:hypothetical protein
VGCQIVKTGVDQRNDKAIGAAWMVCNLPQDRDQAPMLARCNARVQLGPGQAITGDITFE